MKTTDRIIKFTHVNPNTADTGCGDIYPLASTDLIHPGAQQTASLALAHQTTAGHLHEHKKTREIYICVDGHGSVDWNKHYTCPITQGDIVDIKPGTLHGLNAAPGTSVQVLVISHPAFDLSDNYKINDGVKKREEKKPPFFISGATHYLGTLITHPHLMIRRLSVEQSYLAQDLQLLFIIRGTGIFKANNIKTSIEKYDSAAMQVGDSIITTGSEPLIVIIAQVKE